MSIQVWLLGYSHGHGFGRAFNYRTDNRPPNEDDIESMERKLSVGKLGGITVISVTRLADTDEIPERYRDTQQWIGSDDEEDAA